MGTMGQLVVLACFKEHRQVRLLVYSVCTILDLWNVLVQMQAHHSHAEE